MGRLTHALKTALQVVVPVLLYSAALAAGYSARTKAWHSAAEAAVSVVLRGCATARLPLTAVVEMPNACTRTHVRDAYDTVSESANVIMNVMCASFCANEEARTYGSGR